MWLLWLGVCVVQIMGALESLSRGAYLYNIDCEPKSFSILNQRNAYKVQSKCSVILKTM